MLIDILIYLYFFFLKISLGGCAYMCYKEDKDSQLCSICIGLAIGVTISQYMLS